MSNLRERLEQIKAATEGRWINHGAQEGGFEPAPRKAILDGFYELLTLATEAIEQAELWQEAEKQCANRNWELAEELHFLKTEIEQRSQGDQT